MSGRRGNYSISSLQLSAVMNEFNYITRPFNEPMLQRYLDAALWLQMSLQMYATFQLYHCYKHTVLEAEVKIKYRNASHVFLSLKNKPPFYCICSGCTIMLCSAGTGQILSFVYPSLNRSQLLDSHLTFGPAGKPAFNERLRPIAAALICVF